jgi:hypothetical protein
MISANTAWGTAVGTGIVGPYSISFPLYSQTHLTVLLVTNGSPAIMALGTDYTFTAWIPDAKGQVAAPQITFAVAVTSGVQIVYFLSLPGTQLANISNFSAFFPSVHEAEFDKLDQFSLMLLEWAKKTIKAPDQEQSGSKILTLPPAAARASLLLGFDAQGNVSLSIPTTTTLTLTGLPFHLIANDAALAGLPAISSLALTQDAGVLWFYNPYDGNGWEKVSITLP